MAGSSFWVQLKAILVRNFLLKMRGKRHTIVEVVMPLYFILILILINIGIPTTNLAELREPQTYFKVEDASALTNLTIGAVGDGPFEGIMEQVRKNLATVNANLQNFSSEQELLDYFDKNDSVITFAIIFKNYSNSEIEYTIRPIPELDLPDLTELYATEDKCHPEYSDDPDTFRNNEMAASCPARKYYDVGFVQLQTMVDTALVLNRTAGSGDKVPNINVVVFPKATFKGNTEYLRSFVPLYMAIAFTPFVTYLCILIVGEKERKIKDAMKLMGLKSPVYWLGWLITYGVLVILLSLITTLLLIVANITPNANFFLLFVLIALYGFSTITIAFLVTPFFNNAKAAGGFASLSSSLFSCLYYIAVYAKGVPVGAFYALSLLSPTAFALGMDQVVYLDLVDDGISWDTFWTTGYCFGSSVIMLAVDVVLYAFLAYYFDNVVPGEYGRKRPPWFFLLPSYWCPKPTKNMKLLENAQPNTEEDNENFEKVSADFVGKEVLRIFNISKVFNGCCSPEMVAVDGISLDLYEGQITAILGHNGAGKTTLLNMLVGLTSPTSGTATVYGLDISDANNYEEIWNMIGICLQQDVLFDELTPKHHLEFFGRIKGVPENLLQEKVAAILEDVDLTERKDAPAGKLSGGQKRKLSIGIALIGDPKIVILDEPTSGVDPYSRRHLWNLLQNNKKGRLIILTTHFMDEADILADRKAIVSHGKVKCVGSSLFLKNKFGLGYHLTMVVDSHFDEEEIAAMIHSHIPEGKKVRSNASELAFRLPFDEVSKFPALLATLDEAVLKNGPNANVGLKSYGISMTTLEEVFLKLGEDDLENRLRSNSDGSVASEGSQSSRESESARVLDTIEIEYNWLQAFLYMMKLNMLTVLRLPRQILTTVVVPIILIVLTFYLMSIPTTEEDIAKPVTLNLKMYPEVYNVLYTNDTGHDLEPLLEQFDYLGIAYDSFPANYSALLDYKPHTFYLDINTFDATLLNLDVQAAYNDTAQHSLPILMNLLTNALMGIASDVTGAEGNLSVVTSSEPLPRHTVPVTFSGTTMGAVLMIGFAYTMMTAVYSADAVEDRETKVKHQLQVSGLPFSVYWFSKFCGNFVLFAIALVATIIIVEAFQVDPFTSGAALGILVLGYVLYMTTGLLFGYCISFGFDKYESAQSFLPISFLILGFAPYIAVSLCDMLVSDDGNTARIMHYIFTALLPIYAPYSILYYLDKVYTSSLWTGDPLSGTDYFTEEVIFILVALPVQAVLLTGLLFVLDFRSGNGQWSEIFKMCKSGNDETDKTLTNNDIIENEDIDVKEERIRVQNLGSETAANRTSVVVMQSLRKEFVQKNPSYLKRLLKKKNKDEYLKAQKGIKVAVRNLTFAVEKAEVFGLLGPNGAGKTSALRTIVADESPTRGKVTVAGCNMATDLKKAIRNIGYCPQHDALWKSVTVREHLECYASIRGVKRSMIPKVIEALMQGLKIEEHAKKRTEHLSGGTKRKLSYAISMLGKPKIVLLDEPSTGMDPQSKRYLWNTIMTNFQGERGAILTTHSMEEADFLCGRVGIMVKGQLMCIGATQHLKNRYGSGYTLEAKLIASENRNKMLDNLDRDIKQIFEGASIQERFEDRVKYQIPQARETSLAKIFSELEEVKKKFGIEEYSFSQTTLEQVFLEFAKQQEFEPGTKEEKSTNL